MITDGLPPPSPPTHQCVLVESSRQALPPLLVVAVMHQEGGLPGKYSRNRNGSVDLGTMQINSSNIGRIARTGYGARVIDQELGYRAATTIMNDGCVNVSVGAWMLRSCIDAMDGDLFRGVGCYNSPNRKYADKYAAQVLKRYAKLRRRFLSYEWY